MELDALDQLAASAFDGYLVRKDLVRRYSRQYPVPTYVVEFLLGRYCATVNEQEIEEGLEDRRAAACRTGRSAPSEEELFKARAREKGSVKLIDIVKARLDAKNDCFLAELPSLGLQDVRIDDKPRPRARADADRRLLRRGDADLRRGHRGGKERPAVRASRACGRSSCPSRTCWQRSERARAASPRESGGTSCSARSAWSRRRCRSGRRW